MAEIINLRLARKAKARADKSQQAEANRAKFGETKALRLERKAESARSDKMLSGLKREGD